MDPATPNLQMHAQAQTLGSQLRHRLAGLLADLQDPARVALIERQTSELAWVGMLWPAADAQAQAALKTRMDAALAVLYSLASAKAEEAAAAVRGAVADVLERFLQIAIKSLLAAVAA